VEERLSMAKRPAPTAGSNHFACNVGLSFVAATVAETVTFPLDSTKVWLQIRKGSKQVNLNSVSRSNFGQVLQRTVYKAFNNGGVSSFYQGLPVALARVGMSTAAVVSLYGPIHNSFPDSWSPTVTKLLASSLVAITINGVLTPLEVIKTRLQADGRKDLSNRRYLSSFNSIWTFYERNGIRAFWTGGVPTFYRAGLWWAAGIYTYDSCKQELIHRYGFADSPPVHLMSSTFSGIVATIVSHPADVIKTRIQDQSLIEPRYRGAFDCAVRLFKKEGPVGFYRGLLPRYARLGPWQLIFWGVYEQLSLLFTGDSF